MAPCLAHRHRLDWHGSQIGHFSCHELLEAFFPHCNQPATTSRRLSTKIAQIEVLPVLPGQQAGRLLSTFCLSCGSRAWYCNVVLLQWIKPSLFLVQNSRLTGPHGSQPFKTPSNPFNLEKYCFSFFAKGFWKLLARLESWRLRLGGIYSILATWRLRFAGLYRT